LLVEFASPVDKQQFRTAPSLTSYMINTVETNTSIILHTEDIRKAEAAVISTLSQTQLLPIRLEVFEPTLESLFMEVVK